MYRLKVSTRNLPSIKLLEDQLFTSPWLKSAVNLPKKRQRHTILKAPHVNKKAKEHFQSFLYNRLYSLQGCSLPELQQIVSTSPNDLVLKITKVENGEYKS